MRTRVATSVVVPLLAVALAVGCGAPHAPEGDAGVDTGFSLPDAGGVCVGSPTACSDLPPSDVCRDARGCEWVALCEGDPVPCNAFTDPAACALQMPCEWRLGQCVANIPGGCCVYACESFVGGSPECAAQMGCTTNSYCRLPSGAHYYPAPTYLPPCSQERDASSCQVRPGCAWQTSDGSAPPCFRDRNCDDGDPCTVDTCGAGGVCAHAPPDLDGDGHTDAACGGDDCDDMDAMRHPGLTEVCDARHDEDCDPTTFGADGDADGDGYAPATCCNGGSCGRDCLDTDPAVHPGATEVCNGLDDDCNGVVDDGFATTAYYTDCDGDGQGLARSQRLSCGTPTVPPCAAGGGAWVTDNSDCDDANAAVHRGATEVCDGIDDDCDGAVDPMSSPCVPCSGSGMPNACGGGVACCRDTTPTCGAPSCMEPYQCDGNEDCPGGVCCADYWDFPPGMHGTQCRGGCLGSSYPYDVCRTSAECTGGRTCFFAGGIGICHT